MPKNKRARSPLVIIRTFRRTERVLETLFGTSIFPNRRQTIVVCLDRRSLLNLYLPIPYTYYKTSIKSLQNQIFIAMISDTTDENEYLTENELTRLLCIIYSIKKLCTFFLN